MTTPPPGSDRFEASDRLDALEHSVSELGRELRELRAEVARLSRPPGPAENAASPAPSAGAPLSREPPQSHSAGPGAPFATADRRADIARRLSLGRRSIDLESLIGRYGTLALASLTILMGVGAFLGWAIANGKIGPGARVLLGALAAAAVGATGWRLRERGARRFGNTLLALALALVHVDAWGAGPYLGLIPYGAALGVAAAASLALAWHAWRREDEALFCVGVGGAILAPYVTSSGSASVPVLLAYGFVVLASGLAALRGRGWRVAVTLVAGGSWLYAGSAAAELPGDAATLEQDLPALFALAIAWTALGVTGGAAGVRVARSALVVLLATVLVQAVDRAPAVDLLVIAAAATLTAWLTSGGRTGARRRELFAAAVLPLGGMVAALFAAPDSPAARTAVAAAWGVGAVVVGRLHPDARATHYMAAGFAAGAALLLWFEGRPIPSSIALAAHAAVLSLVARRERSQLLGVPIALALALATGWAFDELADRPLYGYRPFLTAPSVAAAAVSFAWLVVSWNASRTTFEDGRAWSGTLGAVVRLAGSAVAFLWVREELARAGSAEVATFSLIIYYASSGVAAIFVGRRRRIAVLRHVGLALALYSALKAVAQASSLAIGLRVGSYFLAGVFLLAVAYWYRARDDELEAVT